ncbi:MAG: hypothetical protein H6837_15585 [Planctomycetes bacterium]|nr:hypothetical protein [Planctomycetota bacterium]
MIRHQFLDSLLKGLLLLDEDPEFVEKRVEDDPDIRWQKPLGGRLPSFVDEVLLLRGHP